ncbi:MAG TPA: pyruvate, water dikinase regulatory protein [Steroidobacteraceae bacterium]|nr:pyruvate, water dikinase regulatory protein [Steroidobacteraceae bacterium]
MNSTRTLFIVSDGTGITAETLGHSLISQFKGISFRQIRMPFVTAPDLMDACLARIAEAHERDGMRPVVVSTLIDPLLAAKLRTTDALILNLFDAFIAPLEQELGVKASHAIGQSHSSVDSRDYAARMDAVNFTLAHDDGVSDSDLDQAEVILVGVSRSGKTPTSLYLALQFGLKTANYPLIPEDFERQRLPVALNRHRHKLFGLSISPARLASIRQERRPDSRYASVENCVWEVDQAQRLMKREGIRWLDSTTKSIEEISATLMQTIKSDRPLC